MIELVFDGSEAAYAEAWIAGTLPVHVRRECHTSMDPAWFQALLLQQVSRQLTRLSEQMATLIAVVSEPVGGYPAAPPE